MRRQARQVLVSSVVMALVMTALLARPAVGAPGAERVLVLHSYHPGLSWDRSIQSGIEEVLAASEVPVDLFIEFMDTKRHTDQAHFDDLRSTLARKYAGIRFAAVISLDNNAFEFLREHAAELFPHTPVVFCGVNDFDPASIEHLPLFTGTAEAVAIDGTIEAIVQVQPGVRRVFLFGGHSATWARNAAIFRRIAESGAYPVELVEAGGLDVPAARQFISTLGPGDAVIIGSTFRDGQGAVLDFEPSTRAISEVSPVPVYGLWDFQLGHGIVGGRLISGREQGATAARMALEIMDGRPPAQVGPVLKSPNRDMFDYTELMHHFLDPDRIPEGSVVIHEPTSIFHRNRALFTGLFSVMFALVMVIVTLVLFILSRRRTQQRLAESERTYRAMFNATKDAILVHDAGDGSVVDANDAAAILFGLDREALLGATVAELSDADEGYDQERAAHLLRRAVEEGPQVFEWRSRRADGTVFWSEVTLRSAEISGQMRILAVLRDIDERKRAEADLHRVMAKLEEKNAELERFTYTVSHDLKSPIITIKGFAGMLSVDMEGGNVARAREDLARIDSAADKMAALLDELLELSRVGRLVTSLEDVSVTEVAREAVELVSGRLDECGAEVVVQRDMPQVCCERIRLREVFQNLLDNAAKFRREEETLRVDVCATEVDGETVYQVRDNGIGIDPRYGEKVFEIFEQIESDGQGTGIGLALVRRIIEYHGGRIWVESEGSGRGVCFCFTLGRPERQDAC